MVKIREDIAFPLVAVLRVVTLYLATVLRICNSYGRRVTEVVQIQCALQSVKTGE